MQKIKMSVCWMLMILLGCRLSHATQPQSPCNCSCSEERRNICETHKEEVYVPCPNVTASEMAFQLIRDQEVISDIKCNENQTFNCTPSHGLMLPQNTKDKLLKFILNDSSSQGVYRCQGEILFPPPYHKVKSEVRIQVVVRGRRCDCKENTTHNSDMFWIWIIVIVLLITYGLTVTITAFVIWIKLRKTDSQSDYMNTKPRVPRDRKKKRGLQYPIPRYI